MLDIRKLLIFLLIPIILMSNSLSKYKELLTPQNIVTIENGILKEAIKLKNYNDIASIAISFYGTSKNINYIGNKEILEQRALKLLNIASKNNNLNASIFLMLNFLKTNPLISRDISKKVLLRNINNKSSEYLLLSKTFVTTYVSLTLDHFSTNVKELNFALESLESLKSENPQINLYRAFLFKALDSDDLADLYLNKACNNAKSRTILSFCSTLKL